MAALIWSLLLIAVGVAALAYSSDWFVDGAAVLADRLSVPPVVIGTLVIGLVDNLLALARIEEGQRRSMATSTWASATSSARTPPTSPWCWALPQ